MEKLSRAHQGESGRLQWSLADGGSGTPTVLTIGSEEGQGSQNPTPVFFFF